MSSKKTWLGIDFSGNADMWEPDCVGSNVWIAVVQDYGEHLELKDLKPVQELPERYGEQPFDRLVEYLKKEEFAAAGIDAPFSLPRNFVPKQNYSQLLELVRQMEHPGRPFPEKDDFINRIQKATQNLTELKPLRETEKQWNGKKDINVRSTMWAGSGRPGTPMTAACLKLLALRGHPIWPWEKFEERTLVEAFPSAQINTWKESIQKYQKGPKNPKIRGAEIIKYLEQEQRLQIPCELRSLIKYIPDARDAVICVFAAIAVTEPKKLVYESDPKFYEFEGWIAVHR